MIEAPFKGAYAQKQRRAVALHTVRYWIRKTRVGARAKGELPEWDPEWEMLFGLIRHNRRTVR